MDGRITSVKTLCYVALGNFLVPGLPIGLTSCGLCDLTACFENTRNTCNDN